MITLHHLDFSRSTRVLWLLEELGLEYDLRRYHRKVGGPAPAELKTIHPLGTSPVIVDGDLVLAESSAILRYIDRHYGGSRFTPGDPARRALHDEWIDYVEGSFAMPVVVKLMGGRDLPDQLAERMAALLAKNLEHVSAAVTPGPYLMGAELTLADMQMSYSLAVTQAAGLLRPYPALTEYLDRLFALPALQRAIQRGGPMTG